MTNSCPNIGKKQKQMRLMMGMFPLFFTLVMMFWISIASDDRSMRFLIFIPLMATAIPYFQVRASTCVFNSFAGIKNMDDGNKAVTDSSELSKQRKTAIVVLLQSILLSALLTLAYYYV